METLAPADRRPALVWFTLVLLVLLGGLVACAALLGAVLVLRSPQAQVLPVVLGLLVRIPLALALVVLFIGLVHRRSWAWHGTISFATCLFALAVYSAFHPSPEALFKIAPSERIGAYLGKLLFLVFVAMYPIRVFLSSSVRAYLAWNHVCHTVANDGLQPMAAARVRGRVRPSSAGRR